MHNLKAMEIRRQQRIHSISIGDEKQHLRIIEDFGCESKKLWKIAGPAIFTGICQYSLEAITQAFAGFLGELDLAAVAVEVSFVSGLAYGVLLGMSSALETLCGQAYGAGHVKMLGVYMQRSWVILLTTACLLLPFYVCSSSILKLIGQTTDISHAAGKFAIWMLPQMFAFAMDFPIQKFLQAQSKVKVMALISAVVMVLHIFFSWLLMLKLGWGLVGAAIALNTSCWLLVIAQLLYIFITKSDGAWNGFSWLAFSDLFGFVKLSIASAIMLCLEFWYLMVLVVITGRLENPLIPVDAISICMNIQGSNAMIPLGFCAAISVRVANELGAGNAKAAKFAVLVVSITGVTIGVITASIAFATRNYFPHLFTNSEAVARETTKFSLLLTLTILLFSLQPILTGVAIGAGWQYSIAVVNVTCYYIVGLPVGLLLGFKFDYGAEGIWSGLLGGIFLQTLMLVIITSVTKWKREAEKAERRVIKMARDDSIESSTCMSDRELTKDQREEK